MFNWARFLFFVKHHLSQRKGNIERGIFERIRCPEDFIVVRGRENVDIAQGEQYDPAGADTIAARSKVSSQFLVDLFQLFVGLPQSI